MFSAESALRETYDAVSYPVPFAGDSDIGGEHWWARAWDGWTHENGARGPFRANHINNSREEAHRGSALPNSFCCEIAYDDDSRDRQPWWNGQRYCFLHDGDDASSFDILSRKWFFESDFEILYFFARYHILSFLISMWYYDAFM